MTEKYPAENIITYQVLAKVKQLIKEQQLISPGDRIIAAVSGGADSVALMEVLWRLTDEYSFSLAVVHVNHLLRGKAAAADAQYVADLAAAKGIPCTIRLADVAAEAKTLKLSKQDAARKLRYQALEEEAANWSANKIALGHHADDQAETILLHLLRGSGLEGLTGMMPLRDNRYLRPLLEVTRAETEAFCQENDLFYCTDQSNLEPVYLRNKIRLELLPTLQANYNPKLVQGLGRLGKVAREENRLLAELAAQALAQVADFALPEEKQLNCPKLLALPLALQRRVLILAWQLVAGTHTNLEFERVEAALDLAQTGQTSQALELPGRVRIEKSYNRLILRRDIGYNAIDKQFAYPLTVPGELTVPELGITVTARLLSNAPRVFEGSEPLAAIGRAKVYLDADRIAYPLTVRNRRQGDRFHPLGAPGGKKLKDFLIDHKVPKALREQTLLVCDSKQVLWVVDQRLSEAGRVTAQTTRILELTVEKRP